MDRKKHILYRIGYHDGSKACTVNYNGNAPIRTLIQQYPTAESYT